MIELRERIFAAVAAEPSLPRRAAARRRLVLLAGAAMATMTIFLLLGGVRPTGRPLALWAATSVGAFTVSVAALVVALRRGRSMLGRSAALLVGLAVATPLLLLVWKAALSSAFAGMTVPWPERPGLRCLGAVLATGIVPILAFLHLWRGTAPAHPRLTGMALGTAAGALAWVLVELWCPVGYFYHLLVGHVLPLVVMAGAGAAAGGLLDPRRS